MDDNSIIINTISECYKRASKKISQLLSSHILEEFKLFVCDYNTGLFLNEKHHVVALLGCCLILLHFHLSLHKVLKSNFRILIHGSKINHDIVGVVGSQTLLLRPC